MARGTFHVTMLVAGAAALLNGAAPAFAGAENPDTGFESPNTGPNIASSPFSLSPFQASARAFFGFDTNVLLVSDHPIYFQYEKGPKDSLYAGLTLNGSGRWLVAPHLTLGFGVRADGTIYTREKPPENHATEYNFAEFSPTVFGEYDFALGAMAAQASFAYIYVRDDGNLDSLGLVSHQARERLDVGVTPELNLFLEGLQSFDSFDVDFPHDPDDTRDDQYWSATAGGRWYFDGHRRSLGLSIGYASNDAKGRNWDYDGWNLHADLRTHIIERLYGSASIGYSDWDYKGGFANLYGAPPRESQQITTLEGRLIYVFSRMVMADAYVRHQNWGANVGAYEGDRTQVGVGLTVSVP